MRLPNLWLVGLAMLPAAGWSAGAQRFDVKVLYAGHTASDRGRDFVTFLGQHFARVTAVPLTSFTEAAADGHDIVVFDWSSIYPRNEHGTIDRGNRRLKWPPKVRLSRDFDRPAVLIGAAGGQIAGPLKLKIGWL